jgi:hypothetical protein
MIDKTECKKMNDIKGIELIAVAFATVINSSALASMFTIIMRDIRLSREDLPMILTVYTGFMFLIGILGMSQAICVLLESNK